MYQVASWSIQPFGHNTWAENWGLCPFRGGTMSWPRPDPGSTCSSYQVASWSIQPFGHNTPTWTGQRTQTAVHRIGRTILQTVAQKPNWQAGWFLRPDCAPRSECPPVRNGRRTSCPIASSERAQIPNFRTCSIPNLWTRPMSSFWTYVFAARLYHTLPAANGVVRCATIGACRLQRARAACGGRIALDGGVVSILALWR